MWSDVIFPYAHESDCLNLYFQNFKLDNEPIPSAEVADREQKTISLFHIEKAWSSALCDVTVQYPEAEFIKLLPQNCTVEDSVDCWILVRNSHSRIRSAEKLQHLDGAWKGSLCIEKADLRKETTVTAVCVLSRELDHQKGLAFEKGESIATSLGWRLYVDEPTVMPGGGINSEWVKFSKSSNATLRSKSDCMWHVEYEDSEPKLLLNEEIPGLRPTLSMRGQNSIGHRIKDALIHSLNQGVLLELCTLSLMELEDVDVDNSTDWRCNLLDYIARSHKDEESDKVRMRWIEEWRSTGNTHSAVLSELSTCIQRTLKISHSSEYLIKIHEARIHHEE